MVINVIHGVVFSFGAATEVGGKEKNCYTTTFEKSNKNDND